jgi:acyl carrier protein
MDIGAAGAVVAASRSRSDMNQTSERLLECFRAVFPELDDGQLTRLKQTEESTWDSLASLSLITVIEEEFDTVLDDESIPELNSFEKIRDALAARAG